MGKVLIITSVASMVDQFLLPSLYLLQEMGYKVEVACNFEKGNTCSIEKVQELKKILNSREIEFYQVDFARNVMQISQNIVAYKQILKIVSSNQYDLIHCHSPIGGLIGRIAARKARRKGTKVFYTVHGFHFYKGAPIKTWILYYPVEKFCSCFTDVLITINQEDYALAKKKMKSKRVEYVPGVGIDQSRFDSISTVCSVKRVELGVPEDAFLLLSVGELNENKNHQIVIKALAKLNNPKVHYMIAGVGDMEECLTELAKNLGVSQQLHLLGFRKDIVELYKLSDVFLFPSFREGLSVSLMEAMACGLPVVCSKIRGNIDLIDDNGGILFDPHSVEECYNALKLIRLFELNSMQTYNSNKVKFFELKNVKLILSKIYERELNEGTTFIKL